MREGSSPCAYLVDWTFLTALFELPGWYAGSYNDCTDKIIVLQRSLVSI